MGWQSQSILASLAPQKCSGVTPSVASAPLCQLVYWIAIYKITLAEGLKAI